MKTLIVLAVAALSAAPAFAENMKWNGSAGWRYESGNSNDQLGTVDANGSDTSKQNLRAHAFRANVGVTGGWKDVEYGVGVRTQNAANNDWTAAGSAGAGRDFNVGFEQAWLRYGMGSQWGDFGFTFGRQMNVFAYEKFTQNLFDNDVRFDGASLAWNWGMFGVNAAYYVLGGRTGTTFGGSTTVNTAATEASGAAGAQQSMVTATGVQPHISWKFRDNIETMFAVGYYNYNKTDGIAGFANQAHGVNTAMGFTATGDAGTVNMKNPRQWQFYNTWALPYNLTAQWEYVMNKAKPTYGATTVEVDSKAWTAGIAYGSIKKAHDFKVAYAYGEKDLGSVSNIVTNDRWTADNKGHLISATYALADNFELGWNGYFLKEKSKKAAATGLAVTTAQENKTNYWELTAGVMF